MSGRPSSRPSGTRYRCSSSGLLLAVLVVALAGCGGGSRPSAFPDPTGPLDVHAKLFLQNEGARVDLVTFRGAGGKVVRAYVAYPRHRPGRHPAVLFLHGSGGSMSDFLVSDARFAVGGGVGMSIQQPNDTTTWAPLVENARRALDVLVARSDVDPKRLGIAGISLGAETAAIVGGVDPRPRVFGLMSCRGTPVVVRYLRLARGSFYVQDGLLDSVVPRPQLQRTIDAIHGRRRVRWYAAPHTLEPAAVLSQVAWLESELRVSQ